MNRGQRAAYVCFDCGEATKATVAVWRKANGESTFAFVHRAGTGCHKGDTPDQVRTIR